MTSPLATQFQIGLVFGGDWHVGTGRSRLASVDAVVARDADGLPFVPAKSLTGVWRDACETVARTLDGESGSAWSAWVSWLFGTPNLLSTGQVHHSDLGPWPAVLRVGPARYPGWFRDAVRGKPRLTEAGALLRPGVALDAATGTAREDFLRVEERGLRGAALTADVVLAGHDTVPAPAEFLLRAGALLIDGIGGKRNRGAGRVAVVLPGVTGPDPAAAEFPRPGPSGCPDPRLEELTAAGLHLADPGAPPRLPAPSAPLRQGRQHERLRTVRLVLRTLTPLIASDRLLGNLLTTRDVVPGTMLLPALLDHLPQNILGLEDLRVGDAVPALAGPDGQYEPSRPVPATWHRSDKGRGGTVVNVGAVPAPPQLRAKPAGGRIVPAGKDRVPVWRQVRTPTTAMTHAVISDTDRRPVEPSERRLVEPAVGGLYTHQGIAAGTVLASDVVLPESVRLRLAAGDRLRLGRSRKDDYGQVEVVAMDELDQAAGSSADPAAADNLLVWCVSDVLLRDERLAPDPSPERLGAVLGELLDVALATDRGAEGGARPTLTGTVRREGFGGRWGRPRMSLVGLGGGSVITFTYGDARRPDPARLAELQRDGVGDRTVEGYGRLLFNPAELRVHEPTVETPDPDASPADISAREVTLDWPDTEPHPVELAAWRREIRHHAAEVACDRQRRRKVLPIRNGEPSRAQLGVLRAQTERLALDGQLGQTLVRHWLEQTRAITARREAWGGPALDAAENLLLANDVWSHLDLPEAELVLAAGRAELLKKVLKTEAITVLLEELLRQLHAQPAKQEKQQEVPS